MTQTERRPTAPHSIESEESILGAMMLTAEAVRAGLDALDASDFYVPKHRAIFTEIAALNAAGRPIDPVTVLEALARAGAAETVGGLGSLLRIQAATPASMNSAWYAQSVAELAMLRRAMDLGDDLKITAREGDVEQVVKMVRAAEDRIAPHAGSAVEPGIDVGSFVAEKDADEDRDFVIPDTLARGEVVMFTGGEGAGKTTLMRQLAVLCALGRHPWQRTDCEPLSVLYVDLQDPEDQRRHEFRKFLAGPARAYVPGSGGLIVKGRPQGIDLTTVRDARWLDALVAHHQPDLLLLGPLYRAYRGSESGPGKHSEEIADEVTDVLTRLMVRRNLALILEGHTLHDGEKANYRPRGARLWEGWPTFGFGLAPVKRSAKLEQAIGGDEKTIAGKDAAPRYRLVSWRGLRDRDRPWPEHLVQQGFVGGGWPWLCPDSDPAAVVRAPDQDEIF